MAESDPGRAAPLARATDWWLHYWRDYSRTAFEANRAVASAFGLVGDALDGATIPPHVPSVAYDREDWSFERSVDARADVGVGDHVSFTKRLSDGDVRGFARASGDTNRLHLDGGFAARTRFGDRIAHGTLVSGLISAALARLPGLTIYITQDLQYLAPVPIGERVTATGRVVEDIGDDRYRLTTEVTDADGETVVDGEAVVLLDDAAEE